MKLQNVILNEVKNLLRMQDISDKQRDPSSPASPDPQDDEGIFWRNRSGLTLIEVLVAMGIASLVGVLLLVIIVNSAGLYTQQSSKVQAGLNSNDALVKIRSTIKDASTVAVSYTSGQTTYTTGAIQLVLKVPAIDSSNNIITNTYDFFIFYLDQKILRFKTFPDAQSSRSAADQIFSTDVENLDFKYFNSADPPSEVTPETAAKVKITLTIKQNTATSEANLRND